MALPPSWVSWLKTEIDKALPTNTTGNVTADAERGILYKIADKSDPLPYVTALQSLINETMNNLDQALRVRIAEVDLKADQINQTLQESIGVVDARVDQTNQVVAGHTADIQQIKNDVAALQQTVGDLGNAMAALEQRVAALEQPLA